MLNAVAADRVTDAVAAAANRILNACIFTAAADSSERDAAAEMSSNSL